VAWLYGFCQNAVVMTDFNRRDPVACGIEKVHVVPHTFVDHFNGSEVTRGGSKVRLLAMGHLCEDKGTRNLILAVAALKSEFPDIILELAGEPLAPYSHEMLRRDLDQACVSDHVVLLGLVSGEAKRSALGRADLFVFPSVAPYESFGLVMVEAMMWGLPVVASDWRGNADVLAGSMGAVTFQPAHSVEALAQCLREILRTPSEWPEMGRANRQVFLSSYRAGRGEQSLGTLLLGLATQDLKA
jgi:glycosyltransferase involved in cell wall biosynthesis